MDKIIPDYKVEIKNADYSSIESAVGEHNGSAKPGEKYWGISMDNGYYTVYEYGEVPEPTPEPEPVEPTIDEVRQNKLDEMSSICEQVIYSGIDVELSVGKKHFSLTANDQTNIDGLFPAITLVATEYPYHADNVPCEMYSASDIITLYIAAKGFVTQQTTYCNALRQWIKREDKIETISTIRYGDTLPPDLQTNVENILTAANAQIQVIAGKLTTAISG